MKNRQIFEIPLSFSALFLVRNADARLTDREKEAVDLWLASGRAANVIKDLPAHKATTLPPGLLGAHRQQFVSSIHGCISSKGETFIDLIESASTHRLNTFIHKSLGDSLLCQALNRDVVTAGCDYVTVTSSADTPCGESHVGQRYEAFDVNPDSKYPPLTRPKQP